MLVWNGKSLKQMDAELFGVVLLAGLAITLFPETVLESLGVKEKKIIVVNIFRILGAVIFLFAFYKRFFGSTQKSVLTIILFIVFIIVMVIFRYLLRKNFK